MYAKALDSLFFPIYSAISLDRMNISKVTVYKIRKPEAGAEDIIWQME